MLGVHRSLSRPNPVGPLVMLLAGLLACAAGLARADEPTPTPAPPDVGSAPPEIAGDGTNAEPWADISGHWEGIIKLPGAGLRVLFDFARTEGGDWIGTMDSPMQGAKGIPLTGIVINGDRVDFTIAGVPGDPTFRGRALEKRIEGEFAQGGQTFLFALGRERLAGPNRPQEPKPPFPYKSEDVTYQEGDITFAGTLTIPEGKGPFPAALLLTGSGPQNRDEEIFGHKPFSVLADFLTRAGIVVLRVDDRGIGGTTGKSPTLTTNDFVGDALRGVAYLRTRPEVDKKKIGLIGHSEGGIIAPLAATRSKDVAYVVMLAGTGVPGRDILLRQSELMARSQGTSEAVVKAVTEQMTIALDLIGAGADTAAIRPRLDEAASAELAAATDADKAGIEMAAQGFRQQLPSMTSAWFRNFITYDPRPTLRLVKVPVLALDGEHDLQVPPEQNIPEIEKALKEGATKDYTVKLLPGLNHLLQPAQTGAVAEYATIETTMDPVALQTIRDWIVERFARH